MGETVFHRLNRRWRSPDCQAGQRTSKTKCPAGGRKPHLKKSDCHLHATLKQRLDAVHKLRFQHSIQTLCRVLRVNRSTYYKHFSAESSPRIKENQQIASLILHIHADYNKRLGAYKIACFNHLHQNFHQKAPNLVWVSDITYLKAGGKWYYLCIVMDLFSSKVISWHISANADAGLVITAFRKAYEKRNAPYGLSI